MTEWMTSWKFINVNILNIETYFTKQRMFYDIIIDYKAKKRK